MYVSSLGNGTTLVVEGLTSRESEILALITQGKSNDDVAALTFLSKNSIKSYIRSTYRKIGVSSRTQAAALAFLERVEAALTETPQRVDVLARLLGRNDTDVSRACNDLIEAGRARRKNGRGGGVFRLPKTDAHVCPPAPPALKKGAGRQADGLVCPPAASRPQQTGRRVDVAANDDLEGACEAA